LLCAYVQNRRTQIGFGAPAATGNAVDLENPALSVNLRGKYKPEEKQKYLTRLQTVKQLVSTPRSPQKDRAPR
jgi:hypothetical protein